MITIFAVPMPFIGQDKISQHNAIKSWMRLEPRPEIILAGDDEGVADFAADNGLRHAPGLGRTPDGYVSVQSMFNIANREVRTDVVALVDSDIILMNDFAETVEKYETASNFLLGGYRRAVQVPELLGFAPGWEQRLKDRVLSGGQVYKKEWGGGSDYHVYRSGLYVDSPDFSLGRGHWDGWVMWHALNEGCELIDCTDEIFAVHQNHPWRSWASGGNERNLALAEDKMSWVWNSTRKA